MSVNMVPTTFEINLLLPDRWTSSIVNRMNRFQRGRVIA